MIQQGIKQQKAFTSRSGAASIYVVVVAALLFSIITVSFIRILLRNASNSAANEMAQMAYDSALAGVEDAKTAMMKYRACKKEGTATRGDGSTCGDIMDAIETSYEYTKNALTDSSKLSDACDSVHRAISGGTGETLIQTTSTGAGEASTTNQAYTCTILASNLKDYRSTLNESNTMRVIHLKPEAKVETGTSCSDASLLYTDACLNETASKVGYLRIEWYSKANNNDNPTITPIPPQTYYSQKNDNYSNIRPPVLSSQLIQTNTTFSLDQFKNSESNQTNRALVYLNPQPGSFNPANLVRAEELVATNNHDVDPPENTAKDASCRNDIPDDDSFACAEVLELPDPVGGNRNWETFYLILNLPYRAPETDFSVRMYKTGCKTAAQAGDDGEACLINFSDVQVAVDSTGRANDLYSRVEARIEFTDLSFPFPQYALQATSDDTKAIDKNFYITQDCIKTKRVSGELQVESCTDSGPSD